MLRSVIGSLFLILVGAILGVSLIGFMNSTEGRESLTVLVSALAGAGVGVAILAALYRIYMQSLLSRWSPERTQESVSRAFDVFKKPISLIEKFDEIKKDLVDVSKLVVNFFLATRTLALVGVLFGAVISIATLLTAYVQIERLEQQNELIRIQNDLAEASRRSSASFELTSILDGLQSKLITTDDQLFIARVSALSRSLRPYRYLKDDGKLSELVSPERAQLLLSLLSVGVSGEKLAASGAVFKSADLSASDLSDRDLTNLDLVRSDLRGARLDRAILNGVSFDQAFLPDALNFTAKAMQGISLHKARVADENWLFKLLALYEINALERPLNPHFLERHNSQYYVTVERIDAQQKITRQRMLTDRKILAQILRWQYADGQLHIRPSVARFEDLVESLSHEHSNEPSVPFGETLLNYKGRIQQVLADASNIQIAPGVRIVAGTNKTALFEFFNALYIFPRDVDFSGISPGNTTTILSLHGDLIGVNLSSADLRYLDFSQTDLSGSDLSGAYLPEAKRMRGVNLTGVNLAGVRTPCNWLNETRDEQYRIRGIDYDRVSSERVPTTFYDSESGHVIEVACVYETLQVKAGNSQTEKSP